MLKKPVCAEASLNLGSLHRDCLVQLVKLKKVWNFMGYALVAHGQPYLCISWALIGAIDNLVHGRHYNSELFRRLRLLQ